MEDITKDTLDAEEADDEQAARTHRDHGARHVTILMAVGFPTDKTGPTPADGAIVAQTVAVDGLLMVEVANQDPDSGDNSQDPGSGDPTDDVTNTAESAVAVDILPAREVDFGWGIVVGSLSVEDSKQIASFPELLATD